MLRELGWTLADYEKGFLSKYQERKNIQELKNNNNNEQVVISPTPVASKVSKLLCHINCLQHCTHTQKQQQRTKLHSNNKATTITTTQRLSWNAHLSNHKTRPFDLTLLMMLNHSVVKETVEIGFIISAQVVSHSLLPSRAFCLSLWVCCVRDCLPFPSTSHYH
jgi:hypothetical protein